MSLGIASERRHLLKPRRLMITASSSFSTYSFSPTMPMSATPVATDWGISSSRRNKTSTGKLVDCTSRVRLEELNLMSDSSRRAIVSSKRRPLACTAILNIILSFSNLYYLWEQKRLTLPASLTISFLDKIIHAHRVIRQEN